MKLIDYLSKEKLTLKKFAEKIGSKTQSVHNYAHLYRYPKPEMAEKIVKATKGSVTKEDIYLPRPVRQ